MCKKLMKVALFCMCLFLCMGFSEASSLSRKEGNQISIRNVSDDLPGAPRSIVPFEAEYNDVLNCVVLTCTNPCGNVAVTLSSTAGDWYQTVFDTGEGCIIVPVSGNSGLYSITIVTSDNTVYAGEFII